jgi:hypothetical protein
MARFSNPSFGEIVTWSPAFTATGLTYTGNPTSSSRYVKNGHIVSFWIQIDLDTVTNFGTGQLKTELPFMPATGTMNHFPAWVYVDPSVNPDLAGHVVGQADHLPNTKELDLHWYLGATANPKPIMETFLTATSPVILTVNTTIYVNGTYFTEE